MATANGLQGGLGSSVDNETVLEEARKRLIIRKEIDLQRLLKKPAVKVTEGRMSSAELARYVDDLAEGAFEFLLKARGFLRKLDKDVQEIGEEVNLDLCEDGDDTRQQRAEEYQSFLPAFLDYMPENDRILREEAELTGRRQFVEALCQRITIYSQIGSLVDDLNSAENKDILENLLEESKYKDKRVFVRSSAAKAPIRAFGKGYEISSAFGDRHHDFAEKKLAEAVNANAKELASAYKTETEKRKQEVFADNNGMSPEELLGDTEEGTAVLSWKFQGHENAVKIRRDGNRLYVIDAVGSPILALEKMREEYKEPFVLLRHILAEDGEHLCPGTMSDGRPRYKFTEVVARQAFAMTLWVRTAFGANCPDRLLTEDETRAMFANSVANGKKPNGNGGKNRIAIQLVDTDGKEPVSPEVFYFRKVNGGAGTITVLLPAGTILHKPNEVVLSQSVTLKIRRLIVSGNSRVVVDECDSPKLLEILEAERIFHHEYDETGKTKWGDLRDPMPDIMSSHYRNLCLSGELRPNTRPNHENR